MFPEYDHLFVISDLHISRSKVRRGVDASQYRLFRLGELLGATIRHLRERDPDSGQPYAPDVRVALVLGGDVLDFLADPSTEALKVNDAAQIVAEMMDDEPEVFDALAAFIQTENRTLVWMIGNHDLEVALPEVQEMILRRLTRANDAPIPEPAAAAARGRLRFAVDGTGHRCQVGKNRVWCFHGEASDPGNYVDHSELRRVIETRNRGQTPSYPPNPGTKLVLHTMNPVKLEWPFADTLKPELEAALPILGILHPNASSQLLAMTDYKWGERKNKRAGRVMGGNAAGPIPPAPTGSVDDDIARVRAADPLDLVDEDGTLSAATLAKSVLPKYALDIVGLRDRIQRESAPDEVLTWTVTAEQPGDWPWSWIQAEGIHNVDVLIAGHTHLRKAIQDRTWNQVYFNSGTWATLMRIDHLNLNMDSHWNGLRGLLTDPTELRRHFDADADRRCGRATENPPAALNHLQPKIEHQPTVVHVTATHGQLFEPELQARKLIFRPVVSAPIRNPR